MEFFCKKLTASDVASGWLYVPRRDAEKVFPSMDYSLQLPSQVLVAKDIHGTIWAFSHKFQGQRHLLNTGWTTFVTDKGLSAGDSVIFVRDEKQQLLVGIRRASREPTNISASILPSDSILAAAAPFTISYYPWDSPSEFVIPFAKYQKAVCNQISLGMRFHMMFETEELEKRRCMGTITGISDLDPVRWKNSQWRSLQVVWDESAAGERRNRVSIWEIEPLWPQPFFGVKRQLDDKSAEMESLLKRAMPSLGEEVCIKDPQTQSATMPGLSLVQWMNMNEQQSSSLASTAMQSQYHPSSSNLMMQNIGADDLARQLYIQNHLQQNNIQFNPPKLHQQMNHLANENLQQQSLMLQALLEGVGPLEISTSMVSQLFGQSNMGFNSIDSAINDGALMNRSSWPPAAPPQRMSIFIKVFKRGAIGRVIDIGSLSGFGELNQALARIFGIEGQLEDLQRKGWRLVYW